MRQGMFGPEAESYCELPCETCPLRDMGPEAGKAISGFTRLFDRKVMNTLPLPNETQQLRAAQVLLEVAGADTARQFEAAPAIVQVARQIIDEEACIVNDRLSYGG